MINLEHHKKNPAARKKFSVKGGKTAVFVLFLLAGCLLAAGCAAQGGQAQGTGISIYYINKAETRITPVNYELEGADTEEQVGEVIAALEENPVELSLRTTINGYDIQSWSLSDKQLSLDVNDDYRKIQPTTEVLIRAALVRTMTQIDGIDHVVMTVNGEALTDSLGVTVGPMTADMFIDNAGKEINAYEKVRLKLYFANESGDGLVESNISMVYSSNISMEKLVVERLVAGPLEDMEGVYPVINPATKVLSVTVKDGTCYVDFDDGFMTQIYNVTGDVVIYSIVNSLVELPNVNKVQIAVDGNTNMVYRENFNLSSVFDRNLDLVYGKKK